MGKNVIYFAQPGVGLVSAAAMSLAPNVTYQETNAKELHVFVTRASEPGGVRWAVLNGNDYTHHDLIQRLLGERIELLVIPTFNTSTRMFLGLGLSDAHRLFCFVVIVNVAEFGGSCVLAPFRHIGTCGADDELGVTNERARLGLAGRLFAAMGPGELRAPASTSGSCGASA